MRYNPLILGIKVLALVCAASGATAFEFQDARYSILGLYGTTARVSDQSSNVAQTELVDGPTVTLGARYTWRNEAGDRIFLDPSLTVRSVPGNGILDDYTAALFGEYRRDLAQFERTQLRLRFGVEHNNRFSEARFNRFTAQAAVNIRHENRRTTTYTLRYRYRNQNEGNSFAGFDQNEYAGNIRYAWSFRDRALEQLAVTPFFDIRDADADNFSSTQVGIRVQGRVRLADDLTLTGRANAFVRNFDDVFSPVFPVARRDRRTSAELELRKTFQNDAAIFGAIGLDNNNSNIPTRDFSGVTFRVGFELTLP